ncbi:exodeoxyribonuclease-3 [Rhizobium mongolense subsp. loessense]|uniref:Exodeoxyribonuclease-3 n=1 Tax=Rhizobium mongolense subsp. loessense TaxID=158890 RepID=A0A1G4UAV7_9HYPH|nr:exodeoxyribonuclease-3 [Rhizobium mongolense subsp. loessense]
MKIATYNVNGVNARLEVLLGWLAEASPDGLQELKAPQEKIPIKAIEETGYGAVWQGQKSWNGVALLAKDQEPHLRRKGLPGDPDDLHSRYIEAIVKGIVIGWPASSEWQPVSGPQVRLQATLV